MRVVPGRPGFSPNLWREAAGRAVAEQESRLRTRHQAPFIPTYSGTSFNVLINESAAKYFGFTPQNAVGKHVFLHNTEVTVVGVLADFKWARARVEPIKPTMFYNRRLFKMPSFRSGCAAQDTPRRVGHDRPPLAPVRAHDRHRSIACSATISTNSSSTTTARAPSSACLSASPSSSPAWACSGWPPSPPAAAPRKSASARCSARAPAT